MIILCMFPVEVPGTNMGQASTFWSSRYLRRVKGHSCIHKPGNGKAGQMHTVVIAVPVV